MKRIREWLSPLFFPATPTSQQGWLKKLLIISAIFHLSFFLIDFSWRYFFNFNDEYLTIEAEYLPESGEEPKLQSVKADERAEKIKVQENMLPQLTKDATVSEDKKTEPAKELETPKDTPKKEEPKQEAESEKSETVPGEKEKPAPPKPVEREIAVKDKAINDLTKQEALERLLKEKARKNKDFAAATQSPLNETLNKRKEELAAQLSKYQIGSDNFTAGYTRTLKLWVAKFYSLPEVYQLQEQPIRAVIEVVLNPDGSISSIRVSETSGQVAFDELALKTLNAAAPFPAPPNDWVGRTLSFPFEAGKK